MYTALEMARKTWTIVKFLGDGRVEVVPSSWVEGNSCYWPACDSKRMRSATKKCEARDESTFARCKAMKAGDTSDLQSDAGTGQKRRIFSRKFSSSEDEGSPLETSLPTPPKMARTVAVSDEIASPAGSRTSHGSEGSFSRSNSQIDAGPSGSCTDTNNPAAGHFQTLIEQNKRIMAQNRAIMAQNNVLKALLIETMERVKTLEKKPGAPVVEKKESFLKKFNYLEFPVNTTEGVMELEEILKDENNFQDAVNEFAKYGGSNSYDFTKRVLSSIVTNDVALQYSWLGRQAKQPFFKLKLAQVVIYAAEKGKVAESRKQSENSIQNWLKRACDRKTAQKSL